MKINSISSPVSMFIYLVCFFIGSIISASGVFAQDSSQDPEPLIAGDSLQMGEITIQSPSSETESASGSETLRDSSSVKYPDGSLQGKDPGTEIQAEGSVSASTGGSDYTATMTWSGYSNPCFIPYSHSYEWTCTLYGGARNATEGSGTNPSNGSVTAYPGPGLTTYFSFKYCYDGLACSGCYETKTVSATTASLKSPTGFSASDGASDKFINLSWGKGTNIPNTHPTTGARVITYYIYRDGTYVGSTENLNYQASVLPGESYNWEVATHSTYVYSTTSSRVSNVGSTSAFRPPINLEITKESYIGYVYMVWGNNSDFATHFRIYRNGLLIATVPASQTSYQDWSVVNGKEYRYDIVSYNDAYDLESASTSGTGSSWPMYPMASDGQYNNRVKISWRKVTEYSSSINEVKIARDGEEIGLVSASATTFYDYDAVPGKIARYSILPLQSGNELGTINEYGYIKSNGKIEGKIRTRSLAGIRDVKVSAMPAGDDSARALSFSGNTDYMVREDFRNFPADAFTISFWVKTISGGTMLSYGLQGENSVLLVRDNNGLAVYIGPDSTGNTGFTLNDNIWHHFALSWNGSDGATEIYVDGNSIFDGFLANGFSVPTDGDLVIGQARQNVQGFIAGQAFAGQLDEIQIWSQALDPVFIIKNIDKTLAGDESGLVSYWPFDFPGRSPAGLAGDFTFNGGNHADLYGVQTVGDNPDIHPWTLTDPTGYYSLRNIYYHLSTDYAISVFKERHGFDPGVQNRKLELNIPAATNVDFTDTTSFTLIGRIVQVFEGDTCFIEGAEMLVDSVFLGQKTSADGIFLLTIEEPGSYRIEPRYKNHTFEPAFMNVKVENDMLGLDFLDTKRDTLQGQVEASCNIYIGQARLRVFNKNNPAGRIDTTITTNQITGYYELILPSREYTVELVEFFPEPQNIVIAQDVISYFNPRPVDLTTKSQQENFIFRKPPGLKITGLPESGCPPFNVPIMEMGITYPLRIEVFENFGPDTCLSDTGFVVIYDGIGGDPSEPDTIMLENGIASYDMVAGFPNLLPGGAHPYQKNFQIIANVEGQLADSVQWVLVEGNKPREQTFLTTSPELPFTILRDPPGDGSYSYLEKNTTTNTSMRFSAAFDYSVNAWAEVKVGAKFLSGFGVYVPSSFWGTVKGTTEIGASVQGQAEFGLSITNTQKFTTSGNPDIIGEEGDVIIGAAMNVIYALTDVITYDRDSCKVDESTSIIIDNDGFATTFMYTEDHIRNTLIPQLIEIRDIHLAAGSDSAKLYTNQIDVWKQTLKLNQDLKKNASFIENRSFSAGAQYEASKKLGASISSSLEFNMYIQNELAVAAGFEVGGAGLSGGVSTKWKYSFGAALNAQFSTERTTGYVLDDDDGGDFFSVNLKHDKVYSTPVFELVSGRSSCPWEPGTQPRDGVQMQIDPFIRQNVPPDMPATFTLTLGNTSQSNEARSYLLSVNQSTNYDGAVIRVGGVVISDYLEYDIPAGQAITATMTVERGPLAYSYPNLQLRFKSACDGSIDTTVNFSVTYQSPCSIVSLFRPLDNWLISQASNDSVQVIIREYDIDNPNLLSVGFEYRKIGGEWRTAFIYQRESLPADFINTTWDVSSLSDGEYEVRAVTRCGAFGFNYSPIARGLIDRNNLLVFGQPQPSDGILNIGEDISIAFTADLDCDRVQTDSRIVINRISDGSNVPIDVLCNDNRLILKPVGSMAGLENVGLRATVNGVYDVSGNRLQEEALWDFIVNLNPVFWATSNVFRSIYRGQPEQVVGELRNQHASDSQTFTLSGIPDWLIPVIQNGEIPAGGSQTIAFNISEQLNPGTYRDTVYAVTPQGNEPFLIEISVLSEPPDWTVLPGNYQYTMTITAEVQFEEQWADDALDILSAFVDDEVRGAVNLKYVPEIDGYLAFLTVYSNLASGEEINFRFWDASSDTEYGAAEETVIFTNNAASGSILNPIVIRPVGIAQKISFNPGWNWFSLNIESVNMDLANVLKYLSPADGDIIRSQTSFSQYVDGIGWIGNLSKLRSAISYQLRSGAADNLWFAGLRKDPATTPVPLAPGWNWIGYLPEKILSVDQALSGLTARNGDRIKSQEAFAEYNESSDSWIGSLQNLEPGKGYMLKTDFRGDFTYSSGAGKMSGKQTVLTAGEFSDMTPANVPGWSIEPAKYEFAMNIIAGLNIKGLLSKDQNDILAAFVGDTCRGFAKNIFIEEMDRYAVFLTVYSNSTEGEQISFRLYDASTDETFNAVEEIIFAADEVSGSVQQPFTVTIADFDAPSLTSAFHYSTEPSLAKYVRLIVAANEPLASPPLIQVVDSIATRTLAGELLDNEENIYVFNYMVEHMGQTEFRLTAADFAGNSTQDTLRLHTAMSKASEKVEYIVDNVLSVSIPADCFDGQTIVFTQTLNRKMPAFVPESIKDVFEIYKFHASTGNRKPVSLNIDLHHIRLSEHEIRKVGLYRFDESDESWSFIAGADDRYRLRASIDDLGTYGIFYDETFIAIPKEFVLYQNYPNPFNPKTTIRFDLPESQFVHLTIYDVLGQKIIELAAENFAAGYHKVVWNGRNKHNLPVTSGIYFYQINAGPYLSNKKMVLLK